MKNKNVLNILVAPLNGTQVKPMLLSTTIMEYVNGHSVSQAFTDSCLPLWRNKIEYDKV